MYVVEYKGKFGFIKPWTAVRDKLTYTQQFLTPSIIEGIEKKLFTDQLKVSGVINRIQRHKLRYDGIDKQQERTQARGWEKKTKEKRMIRNQAVLERGVMINPTLYLAFAHREDAEIAAKQHICLCRNEDLMLPLAEILELTDEEFSKLDGFELRFGKSDQSFLVGYNRFKDSEPMYGWLEISGNPVLSL